jgi:predicted RNase H-like nuclease
MTSFIGLDMAWRIDGNHSGIAVMEGDELKVRLTEVSADVTSMAAVVDFVSNRSPPDTVVAIDASLIVKNATGQRPCEKLISSRFGKYGASRHTSNLGRPYAMTGMKLVKELEKNGFVHDFHLGNVKQRSRKWVFEVYPHPAMVQLFGLEWIIRYKKGHVAEKRRVLAVLRGHLRALADGSRGLVGSPTLADVLDRDLAELAGKALKRYEDTVDVRDLLCVSRLALLAVGCGAE